MKLKALLTCGALLTAPLLAACEPSPPPPPPDRIDLSFNSVPGTVVGNADVHGLSELRRVKVYTSASLACSPVVKSNSLTFAEVPGPFLSSADDWVMTGGKLVVSVYNREECLLKSEDGRGRQTIYSVEFGRASTQAAAMGPVLLGGADRRAFQVVK